MTTSTNSTIIAGSYWRSCERENLVKVIVPYASHWIWRDESYAVVFRTHANRYGEPMLEVVQHFMAVEDFLDEFEPAIWDKEKLTWK